MGMFDYVRCKYPLPEKPSWWKDDVAEAQTKSLDCCLDTYEITADGRLVKTFEHDYPDGTDGDIAAVAIVPPHPVPFTGDVLFYDGEIIERDGQTFDQFVDYVATFVYGELQCIRRTRVHEYLVRVIRTPDPITGRFGES